MPREHSFTITLSNNRTESAGLRQLLDSEPEWIVPDKDARREILRAFELPKSFARAFDLIWIKGRKRADLTFPLKANAEEIILIELKTTRKKLPDNPHGFFFGATQNEFDLAKRLGDSFRFCFVCLHPESLSHKLLTLSELEGMIQTKRVQYQINLR